MKVIIILRQFEVLYGFLRSGEIGPSLTAPERGT